MNVTVTEDDVASAVTTADQFTYVTPPVTVLPPPTITAVVPGSGKTTGGTMVSIEGTNFNGATTVDFGPTAVARPDWTYNSPDSITAYSPPGQPGPVNVRVTTTPGLTSAVTRADRFTYVTTPVTVLPPPTITAVVPGSGKTTGGTMVSIEGTNFNGATTVDFGPTAVARPDWTYNSPDSITAYSPPGQPGPVNVRVTTTPGLTSAVTRADRFTYVTTPVTVLPPPTITAVVPGSGKTTGGTMVSIEGTNFNGATTVDFGPTAVARPDWTYNSPDSITAYSPPGQPGPVNVRVTTTPGLTSAVTRADRFTYVTTPVTVLPPPTITAVVPGSGKTTGGTMVSIEGTNFNGATTVDFGPTAVARPDWTYNSPDSITAYSPPGQPGPVNVRVTTTPGLTSAVTRADRFTYVTTPVTVLPPPTITAVVPGSGKTTGGTMVSIEGTNFNGATTVDFGPTAVARPDWTYNSPDSITAYSPPGQPGPVNVRVTTTPGLTSAVTRADRFTYVTTPVTVLPPPTITAVVPGSGKTTGGTMVSIIGSNLSGGKVYFNGSPGGSPRCEAGSCTARSPSHPAGTVDITVRTAQGTSALTRADHFTYLVTPQKGPVVTGVVPGSGLTTGGTRVTIKGIKFSGAMAVDFGPTAVPLDQWTGFSPTLIIATSPPGSGPVDVRVTTPEGISAITKADRFTYVAVPPVVTGVIPPSGPAAGGSKVTISGSNLGGGSVKFGHYAASAPSFCEPSSCTVTTPPGSGTVDVRVTTPGGTSIITKADRFTYLHTPPRKTPVVTGVAPSSGPATGGSEVTVSGSHLGGGSVYFGNTQARAPSSCTSRSCTVTSPSGFGTVDVRVTTSGGTSAITPADHFSYLAARPLVTGVVLHSGPSAGGAKVIISGSNLNGGKVYFGNNQAKMASCTPGSCAAISPAGSGTVDVTVTTPGGSSPTTKADRYSYRSRVSVTTSTATKSNPSTVSTSQATMTTSTATTSTGPTTPTLALSPAGGSPGMVVTVTGSGFAPGAQVRVTWSVATGSSFVVTADANGDLPASQLLIFTPDVLGPRFAEAFRGQNASVHLLAKAPFLVDAGAEEPGGANGSLFFRSESP